MLGYKPRKIIFSYFLIIATKYGSNPNIKNLKESQKELIIKKFRVLGFRV